MSRSPSADVASPVFGRFLLLVRDWNTGELLPLGRNVVCQCAMCARRRTRQSSPAGAVERPPLRRAGFTLVEMVVVLLILALLTVAAVQSLSPVADQARYEATQRTLIEIQEAILNVRKGTSPDGSLLVSGFVADTGRVPATWDELFERPTMGANMLIASTQAPFNSDGVGGADVVLTSGWNGPYLRIPGGVTGFNVKDGYGQDFQVVSSGGQITVTSLGADNDSIDPETGYDQDIGFTISSADYTANLSFHVYETTNATMTTGRKVAIQLYGTNANSGTDGSIQIKPLGAQSVTSGDLIDFTYPTTGSVSVTAGVVAVRAVVWVDSDNNDLLNGTEVSEKKSAVRYVSVTPGVSRPPVDLELH